MANGKPGPPFKNIGKLEFEKLCALQCTQQEICDFFEVDHRTLTRWCKRTYKKEYSQIYQEKRSGGKIALRRLQMRLAEKSAAMAIFLGKNYLGQSDNPVVTSTVTDDEKVADDGFMDALKGGCSEAWKIADEPANIHDGSDE